MSSNPKLTKARLSNLAKLDAYEPTDSTTRNVLQQTVKELYKKGTIRDIKNATNLMDLLKDNELEKFEKKLNAIETAQSKKTAATIAQEIKDDAEVAKTITIKERAPRRFALIAKNKGTELPTFEIHFKETIQTYNEAWRRGVKPLTRAAELKIKEKHNVKITIGMELEIAKPTEGGTEEVMKVHAHTMPEAAYSEEGVAKLIADKKGDLEMRVNARVDHQVGSGWTVKRITTMYLKLIQ